MTRLAFIFLFAAFTASAVAVTLQWNQQPEAESFNLYRSTNLIDWVVTTNTTGTNVTLPLAPGSYFFKVTASNFWGESGFSATVGTPAPATTPGGFVIRRLP